MGSGTSVKGIGFAGLESLVSDVRIPPVPLAKGEATTNAADPVRASAGPATPAKPQEAVGKPDRDRGRWGVWLLGIIIVGWILFSVISSQNSGTTDTAANTVASASRPSQPAVVPPQGPVVESEPQAGTDLALSTNEIAYCLAFDARLTALGPMINEGSHREVEGFNALVADFNNRCSHYQYMEADMARARTYVSSHASDFPAQASTWLTQLRHQKSSNKAGAP